MAFQIGLHAKVGDTAHNNKIPKKPHKPRPKPRQRKPKKRNDKTVKNAVLSAADAVNRHMLKIMKKD